MHAHVRRFVLLCFAFAFVWLFAIDALATAQRTFVSGTGNDANPCSLALPCRGFAAAIAAVTAGGEVIALDSAGYGTMTVNKPVSIIVPPGVHAAITAFSAEGVLITAASGPVVLRGLYINAIGGVTGILINGASRVQVENCVVSGFSAAGINVFSANTAVSIIDSVVRDNNEGILVDPPSATSPVLVERVRMLANTSAGLHAAQHARVVVRESVASYSGIGFFAQTDAHVTIEGSTASNNGTGFFAYATSVDILPAEMTIDHSVASHNSGGVAVGSDFNNGPGDVMLTRSTVTENSNFGIGASDVSQTMRVSDTTITRNATGILANGGNLLSRGNNIVQNNTTTDAFTGSFVAQ